MKRFIALITFVCLFVSPLFATYTYEITSGYVSIPSLHNSESLLVTGGGTGSFYMYDYSYANVQGTSPLQQSVGGIWQINLTNNSHLDFSGGELHELSMNNNATATLTGGFIQSLYSTQITTEGPHITLYYSGDIPTVQEISGYDYLVGAWGNGTTFQIFLYDTGYDVYGNFDFIYVPEPATLALIGIGGLFLRKKM